MGIILNKTNKNIYMKSASKSAYISDRMMKAYAQKKSERQMSQQQSVMKPPSNKEFSEEAKLEEKPKA